MSEELKIDNEKYKFKKYKGITLISLAITIVVLIILAGVAIYLSLGNNGIYTRAKQAKEATNKQTATEKINLKITTAQMNKYVEKQEMPTLKELSEVLKNDKEIQYVTEKSQIASTKYEVGENPSSIFTKLNEYPYEFEINSSLQLASINGIKIAKTQDEDKQDVNLFDYSNNQERIVGKWVNGKNVYEKFMDLGNATKYGLTYNGQGGETLIPLNEICEGIDEVIAAHCRVTGTDGNTVTLPFGWSGVDSNTLISIYHVYKENAIHLDIGKQYNMSYNKNTNNFQIIVQYTKTND